MGICVRCRCACVEEMIFKVFIKDTPIGMDSKHIVAQAQDLPIQSPHIE